MRKQQIYDQEKVSFNLLKYTKFGKTFELVVEPNLAVSLKERKAYSDEDVAEILRAENVFFDAKKGTLAEESSLIEVFNTKDTIKIAKLMLSQGELQLTSSYREKLREEKRRKIVNIIHKVTINPKTNTPHPVSRIENAILEAKVKIDEFKKAEEQVSEIITKLKPIIPIKKDETTMTIKMPMNHASSLRGFLTSNGKLEKEDWKANGEYECKLKIPSGLRQTIMDELNSKTRGEVQINLD